MKSISIKDKLPEENQWVICTDGSSTYIKQYERGIFYDGDTYCYCPMGEIKGITHWNKNPELPKD